MCVCVCVCVCGGGCQIGAIDDRNFVVAVFDVSIPLRMPSHCSVNQKTNSKKQSLKPLCARGGTVYVLFGLPEELPEKPWTGIHVAHRSMQNVAGSCDRSW